MDQDQTGVMRASDTSGLAGYHPGMTTWMTPDQACAALEVGRDQLAGLARAGLLVRTFDLPEAPGRPRYEAASVDSVVGYRGRLLDPERWIDREQACALLEVSKRGWVKLRRIHEIGDNGSPVSRWLRYDRADVVSLARDRAPGPMTRFLTETQAAEQLGITTAVLARRASRNPERLGFNHRTRRYSAARVADLVAAK